LDVSATITAKELTVANVTANNKVYDAGMVASLNLSSAAFVGVIGGDTVNIDTSSATGAFSGKNVGTGLTVTVSGIAKTGGDASNYSINQPTTTANITARPLTITAATDTKEYNGTTSSAGVAILTSGVLQGSDSATWTQTFDNKNADTGKTLTPAGLVSDGNSGNNYSYTYVTDATGIITPRAITFTAVTDTKVFDNTTSSSGVPTYPAGALQGTDTRELVIQTYDNKDIGTGKTLTPSGVVTDGNSGNNYTYTYIPNNTGVITADSPKPTPAPENPPVSNQDLNQLNINPFSNMGSGIGMGTMMMPMGEGGMVLIAAPTIVSVPAPQPVMDATSSGVVPGAPLMQTSTTGPLAGGLAQSLMPSGISFNGSLINAVMPAPLGPELFGGITPSAYLPQPFTAEQSFGGSLAQSAMPSRISFDGSLSSAVMPAPLGPELFRGITPSAYLPQPSAASVSFTGSLGQSLMPSGISFDRNLGSAALPAALGPELFSKVISSAQFSQSSITGIFFSGSLVQAFLPTDVSFGGNLGSATMPAPLDPRFFNGITPSAQLPRLFTTDGSFSGSLAQASLPSPESFNGITPSAQLPRPFTTDGSFSGSLVQASLPPSVSFHGSLSRAAMPAPLDPELFNGSLGSEAMTVDPVVFEKMTPGTKFKAMFPGGKRIVPTFGLGVPSGADKPLMEPRIEDKGQEK